MAERIGQRLRRVVAGTWAEIRDYLDYRRAFVAPDSPEAAEVGRAYHDHMIKVRNAGRPVVANNDSGENGT